MEHLADLFRFEGSKSLRFFSVPRTCKCKYQTSVKVIRISEDLVSSLCIPASWSSPLELGGRPSSLCGPYCWGQVICWLLSLSHREAVSALLLMGEMCISWPQAEVFASHRYQLYRNIWCMQSALCGGDGAHCQLEEPTDTFHQPRLWLSFRGHKCSQPSSLKEETTRFLWLSQKSR